jgi:CRISPR-associated protein Csb2
VIFRLERVDGPFRHLDLACTLALTARWRDALVSHANDLSAEARSILSGHVWDGAPLQEAHIALLPLGFVGHQYADGHLSGVALALPEQAVGNLRSEVLRAAERTCKEGLKLGRLGAWKLNPLTIAGPLETLCAATWTAHPDGATHWSTVTPIAYDQHPKAKDKAEYLAEVAAMIAAGCERIGLRRPREVIVTPVSAHLGAPLAHTFPRLRRKDGSEHRHAHAIIVFDEPVRGPIMIGAGRYRGYGFCRTMETES